MITVSIIIVNWNTKKLLFDLLTSLYLHAPKRSFEVIVVDNSSSDGSREMVSAEFKNVKVLDNPTNLGFARAVNRGISESYGKYVLLLNTDLIVLAGSIDAQIEFMEETPDCAICGGSLVNDQGEKRDMYGCFPSAYNLLAESFPNHLGSQNKITQLPPKDQIQPMQVDFISGCDLIARRNFFESVGLLDEQLFMYFEDADWGFRAKQAGWKVYYVPSVNFIHFGQGSVGWVNVKKYWIPSLGFFIRKHYHGMKFVVCWSLWQLLRAKYNFWMFRNNIKSQQHEKSKLIPG